MTFVNHVSTSFRLDSSAVSTKTNGDSRWLLAAARSFIPQYIYIINNML